MHSGEIVSSLRVVVSSENTTYLAWQTQLLCYSALSKLQQHPIVIVHQTADPLLIEFEILREMGFQVIQAPSFASTSTGVQHPPRNLAGTLLTVAGLSSLDSQQILLCEPDMLFTGTVACPFQISGERYPCLDYSQDRIKTVASRAGCEQSIGSLNEAPQICAPYVFPVDQLPRIGTRWLGLLDAFDNPEWDDAMYALGLVFTIEGLSVGTTQIVDTNVDFQQTVSGCMIHYRYGDDRWNKRFFKQRSPLDISDVALPTGAPGTVFAEMMTQIRSAKAYLKKHNTTIGPFD